MSPTPVLVEASGTSNTDDASHPPFVDNSATLETVSPYNEYSLTTSVPPSQHLQPRSVLSALSPLSSTSHPGPETILPILQFVDTAAIAVCEAVDRAIELEHEERCALKDLRKGADSLKSDILVYKLLLNAMGNDTDLSDCSAYTRFIQRYVMGCSQTHMLTEPIMHTNTDRMEWKQWKTLKERSRLRFYCSRRIQREITMRLR